MFRRTAPGLEPGGRPGAARHCQVTLAGMSQRHPWQNGRRAWERLYGWHSGIEIGEAADSIAAAEQTLGDVRLVRGLLDTAEMNAVRMARGAGASWTEVATMLGVSRQSAWERWREIDEPSAVGGRRR